MLLLYNIKTWLLLWLCPLQTVIMYQYDAWSWIRVWVNTILKLFISEYGKILRSSNLDNGECNLLRSLVVTKAICAEENEGCMGFAGQRNTLMQCTPSIVIIHNWCCRVYQESENCLTVVLHHNYLRIFIRMLCSEICAWNNEKWLAKCFDHPFTIKHNTTLLKRMWG